MLLSRMVCGEFIWTVMLDVRFVRTVAFLPPSNDQDLTLSPAPSFLSQTPENTTVAVDPGG